MTTRCRPCVSGPFLEEGETPARIPRCSGPTFGARYRTSRRCRTRRSTAPRRPAATTATNGVLTFMPGQTTTCFIVPVTGDKEIENDETFTVTFSNAARDPSSAITATIADDDAGDLVCHDLYVPNGPVNAIATVGNTVYASADRSRAPGRRPDTARRSTGGDRPAANLRAWMVAYAAAPTGAGGWYIGGLFSHVAGMPLRQPRASVRRWLVGRRVEPRVRTGSSRRSRCRATRSTWAASSPRWAECFASRARRRSTSRPLPDRGRRNGRSRLRIRMLGNTLYVGGRFTTFGGGARPWSRGEPARRLTRGLEPGRERRHRLARGRTRAGMGRRIVHLDRRAEPRTSLPRSRHDRAGDRVESRAGRRRVRRGDRPRAPVYVGGLFANIGGPGAVLAGGDRSRERRGDRVESRRQSVCQRRGELRHGLPPEGSVCSAASRAATRAVSASTSRRPSPRPELGRRRAHARRYDGVRGGDFPTTSARNRGARSPPTTRPPAHCCRGTRTSSARCTRLCSRRRESYAGGSFMSAGGQTRNRLAAFDSTTAAVTAWDPNVNNTVRCPLLSGSRLLRRSVHHRRREARVLAVRAFPRPACSSPGTPMRLRRFRRFVTDGTYIYAGGNFTNIGRPVAQRARAAECHEWCRDGMESERSAPCCTDARRRHFVRAATSHGGGLRPNPALLNVTAGFGVPGRRRRTAS